MIDRQQLEAVLQKRFPNASLEQVAAAANAIIGLELSLGSECPSCACRHARLADGPPASSGPPRQP